MGGAGGRPSRGVPVIGFRKFRGIVSTSSSRRVRARSTRSSVDSPMPMMLPEQIWSPAFLAFLMVSRRSS